MAAVLAVAAVVVRWPFIVRGQTLLHSDEAIVGIMAQDIEAARRFPIYFYGQRYMGALEAYVIAALRPLFDDQIISLRLGPACFFAGLVAVQFLMLSRWFGRTGAWVGAMTLLASSPMFLQWSIAARGGYIEILLCGSLLWWAYSEWFIGTTPKPLHKVLLGVLIGSGMWINPTIAVFVAPVLVHYLLGRPLALARQDARWARGLKFIDRSSFGLPLALPLTILLLVIGASSIMSVRVAESEVQYAVLMNLLPREVALLILAAVCAGIGIYLRVDRLLSRWMERLSGAGPFVFGLLLGNLPSLVYVIGRTVARQPMDDSLPLGLRPIWTIGENLVYMIRGVPLLLGADPGPFLQLVSVGRSYEIAQLSAVAEFAMATLNLVVLGGLMAAMLVLCVDYGEKITTALRLKAGVHPPVVFLTLALFGLLGLYLVSGCTVDFTSIRYLVPIWAIVPGILAAVAVSRQRGWVRAAPIACLLLGWGLGQVTLAARLGRPHPLAALARSLKEHQVEFALAEPLDAHLLSFLTEQDPPVAEFQSFWPRLGHLRSSNRLKPPVSYVVHATDLDWTGPWHDAQWPGPPPPETSRFLWSVLKQTLAERPEEVLSRIALSDGYELWTLAHPLPEQTRGHGARQ